MTCDKKKLIKIIIITSPPTNARNKEAVIAIILVAGVACSFYVVINIFLFHDLIIGIKVTCFHFEENPYIHKTVIPHVVIRL